MVHDRGTLLVEAATDFAEWDRFVAQSGESTFSHRAGWRDVMRDVLGHDPCYLVALDTVSGTLRGVLPLVRVRSVLGQSLISLPFMNDGGPIGDAAAREALSTRAVALAREARLPSMELRGRSAVPGPALRVQSRKIAVHLLLPESVEALWTQTFKAKLRSQIRRPSKEGMTARSGSSELVPFYSVFARNMRDLGTPVLPRRFFEALVRTFGDDVLFFTVYSAAGQPVAASCCLMWQREIEVTWASSLREFNPMSPNMLLYATMMEESIKRGMRVFNFGRSTPGAATHRFKQQWGGVDVPLPWSVWSRADADPEPAEASRVLLLASALWQRLPMAIANRLGPMLSRHLP